MLGNNSPLKSQGLNTTNVYLMLKLSLLRVWSLLIMPYSIYILYLVAMPSNIFQRSLQEKREREIFYLLLNPLDQN